MASKKPAAKPAKKTKQKITAKLLPKTRSPKKMAARKSKPSKAKRYAAREGKRLDWAKKNPGMVPGAIGEPAHPAKLTNSDDVAKVLAGDVTPPSRTDPDETVPGPGDVKTVIEVADEIKMQDKLEAPVTLDTSTGTYVAPTEDK